jgi:hypothetical protein
LGKKESKQYDISTVARTLPTVMNSGAFQTNRGFSSFDIGNPNLSIVVFLQRAGQEKRRTFFQFHFSVPHH